MNVFQTILKYITVIVMGILVFWLDEFIHLNKHVTVLIIMLIAISKASYFMLFSFRKILEVSIRNIPYHSFLLFMAANVLLIVISFSIDFFCLSEVDTASFIGINNSVSFAERYFDFLYFSVLAFTNFGYDQVSPRTIAAKSLMALELIISFATIIFILSDFISLKDSLSNSRLIDKKDKQTKS